MIKRFLFLNGVAILSVIFFHAAGWGFVAMFPWADRYTAVSQMGSPSYYVLRVVEQLVVFAIPAFLFISGFFLAFATGRKRKTVSWNMVGIRIKALLIPYLLWSFLLFVSFFVEGRTLSIGQYAVYLLTGQTNPAYYYVPLLIQLYLLAPFLIRWAKAHWASLLIIAGVVQFVVQGLHYLRLLGVDPAVIDPLLVPKWLFPTRIFWFALGIVAGFHIKELEQFLDRIKWGLVAGIIIMFPLGIIEWELIQSNSGQTWLPHRETLLDSLYSVAVMFAIMGFSGISIPFSKSIEELAPKSFGIYLMHAPVMEYVARGVYLLAPGLLAYQIVLQPLLIGLGLGIPLLVMAAVNWSPIRIYYKYAFG